MLLVFCGEASSLVACLGFCVVPVGISTAVEPLERENLAEKIEQLSGLDAVADPLQRAVMALIPAGSKTKDALSGTWFGHPLHPPLTDLVIGPWTSALFLDLVGGEGPEEAADCRRGRESLLLSQPHSQDCPTGLTFAAAVGESAGAARDREYHRPDSACAVVVCPPGRQPATRTPALGPRA